MIRTSSLLSFAFVVALALPGCSDDDATTTPEPSADTGTTEDGSSTTDTGSGTDTATGEDTATAEDTATTGDTATAEDTATAGDTGAGDTAGDGGTAFKVVQDCAEGDYVDATKDASKRTISPWNLTIGKKCITIKKGQKVTWDGTFAAHPLIPEGGDTPNPITKTNTGTSQSFTFDNEGIYGYRCELHASMKGAIRVIP